MKTHWEAGKTVDEGGDRLTRGREIIVGFVEGVTFYNYYN